MLDKIIEFSSSLRAAGIPVSIRSTENAYRSAVLVDDNMETLREALACVYVKDQEQREKFDMIFNIIFQKKLKTEIQESGNLNKAVPDLQDITGQQANEIKESRKVNKAVTHLSNEIQNMYIDKKSGNSPKGDKNLLNSRRLSGRLNPEITRLDNKTRQKAVEKLLNSGYKTEDVLKSLNQHDINSNIEKMNFTDLLLLNNMTLNQLYPKIMDLCQKLGRKIATKRSRRCKLSSKGKINIRKTIRKNMKHGGVFLERVNEKPKLNKMNHFFLSDISASCDWVSNWFFCMIYASQRAFNKARIFEYDNEIIEVTSALDEPTIEKASDKVLEVREKNEKVNRCSNMFSSFKSFLEESNITNKSYVIILTDCRDWMGPKISEKPRSAELIQEMVDKSKRVLILNPEPKIEWNKFGSCVSYYEDAGAELFNVQNLEQLANLISEI
ncbi:VWA domain-containing protein [Methanobacterium sp.]|uniref:VWA domain-containing protein n=1 Tax=Methanobacterium sp. TaxID=2164 RepID=UPI003C732518